MPEHTPKLPTIQKVEQHKPIDLSGQSKKALEIKSTIASIKSPIDRSGVFTKMNDSLIKMEKHLSKLRDFAAAKTDVKWNEKTGQYHATLDSNKMVPFSDTRVPEGATRAEPMLDEFQSIGKEGSDDLLEQLEKIEEHTRNTADSLRGEQKVSSAEQVMEDAYQEDRDKELAKRAEAEKRTLGGIWKEIKEGNKENWFVKNWKMILGGLFLLFAPLKWLGRIFEVFKGIALWAAENPATAIGLALTAWLAGPAIGIALASGIKAGIMGLFGGGGAAAGGAAGGAGIMGTLKAAMTGGITSPAAIVAAIVMTVIDGIQGWMSSSEWGVSKIAGMLGGMFTSSKGWVGMFTNMGKWAVAGAMLGAPIFGIGAIPGGLIGAAMGAIFNLIGGKRMAQAFENLGAIGKWILSFPVKIMNFLFIKPIMAAGKWIFDKISKMDWFKNAKADWDKGMTEMKKNISHAWQSIMGPFVQIWDSFSVDFGKIWDWLVDPNNVITADLVLDFISPITDWFDDLLDIDFENLMPDIGSWYEAARKKMQGWGKSVIGSIPEMLVPDSLLEWAGIKTTKPETTSTTTTTTDTDDGEEQEKQAKIKTLRTSIAEHEKAIGSGDMRHGFSNMWSREESIKKAKKEIKELGGDVGSDTTTTDTDTGDGGSTDGTKIKKLAYEPIWNSPVRGQGMYDSQNVNVPEALVDKVMPIWNKAKKESKKYIKLSQKGLDDDPETIKQKEKAAKLFAEVKAIVKGQKATSMPKTTTPLTPTAEKVTGTFSEMEAKVGQKNADTPLTPTADKPGTTAPQISAPPLSDFKTPIEGMDAITSYRDWKKSKKSRISWKKAANKKEAITNLVDMLKDLPPSELEATVAKLNPKEIRAIRTSGLAKDLESKHPLFKKKKSDKEVDLTTGQGPADVEAISARINKEQKEFRMTGNKMGFAVEPIVSPADKTGVMKDIHTEAAELKDGQAGGSTGILNAPSMSSTVNNNGDQVTVGSNNAQGGMSLMNKFF